MEDSKMTLVLLVAMAFIWLWVESMPVEPVLTVVDTWKESAIYQCKAAGNCL
jgi:hypothetical protein